MAEGITIDVGVRSDAGDLRNLGQTLDDVAARGETMGSQLEQALTEAERRVRPTNSEYRRLAGDLERYARQSGQSMSEAFQDFERYARDAGLEVSDGVMDALRRLGSQGPSDVDKVSAAFKDLSDEARRSSDDVNDSLDDIDVEGPLTKTQDLANEVRASLGETLGELSSTLAEGGASMEDMVDGVVEVSAEAAGGLPGPWGLAGQALIAVASSVYGAWKKRQEDIAADASAMYQDMLDSGAQFLSDQYFQTKLSEFFDPMGESYESNMDKLNVLEDLGVPMDEAARALVGYGTLSDDVLARIDRALGANNTTIRAGATAMDALGITSIDVLAGISRDLEDNRESANRARASTRSYRDAIEELPSQHKTDVDVDDDGSIRNTQRKINDIHGGEATIRVRADTSSVFEGIAAAVAHAGRQTATIPVTARRVGGFYA